MTQRPLLAAWLLGALLGPLLGSCSGRNSGAGAPNERPFGERALGEQSLLVGLAGDAMGLDPARVTDAESVEVCEQIYETLVRVGEGGAIEPGLATRWEVSPDGKEWTFHLRQGVRFHDGTPLDAEAVVYSLERQRDPRHPAYQQDFSYRSLFNNVVHVMALDRGTVRIALEQPYAPFLANLSMFSMAIVSPRAVARQGDDFRRHPVGTGPFRFVEWQPGERLTLEANPSYWGGTPKLRRLTFVPVRDPRQRLLALEGGTLHVAENLAPRDLQFVALHPELQALRADSDTVGYLAMNTRRAPFDDVRIRRAVNLAIDKQRIVRLAYQGVAREASGPLPPSMWGHVELPRTGHDPAAARRLLIEAGWLDAEGRPRAARRLRLYTPSTPRPYLPDPERVARMIAADLRDVGIDVEVVVSDFTAHLHAVANGEHDLCLLGWTADNGDPDNLLYTLFHSDNAWPGSASNLSFLVDPELDGVLRWAQETLDHAQRVKLYARAQRIIAERAPWVPLVYAETVVARRRTVRGLRVPPTATIHFRDAEVDAP